MSESTGTVFDPDSAGPDGGSPMTSSNISLANPVSVPGNSYNVMPQSVVFLENTATVTSP